MSEFYSVGPEEHLTHTDPQETIEAWLDYHWDGRDIRLFIADEAPLELIQWRHKEFSEGEREVLVQHLIDIAMERIDEELAGDDSCFDGADDLRSITSTLRGAVDSLCEAADPWKCEVIARKLLSESEILELASDWISEAEPTDEDERSESA